MLSIGVHIMALIIQHGDSKFYLTNQILMPTITGDSSLEALIVRLVNKGYYSGQAAMMNYSGLAVTNYTYIVKWQYSFDNAILVECYRLYTNEHKFNWLYRDSGTWSSTWYDA